MGKVSQGGSRPSRLSLWSYNLKRKVDLEGRLK